LAFSWLAKVPYLTVDLWLVIRKKFLNTNLFLIKTFLITKFDCIWQKINILRENHCTFWIHSPTVLQKVPKSDFQSWFSMSRIIRIFFCCFFQLRAIVDVHNFCKNQFLITSIFETLYFLKSCPIFDEMSVDEVSMNTKLIFG